MNQLERSISSLEIAEMVGRNHHDVLRDIRKVIGHLSTESNFALSDYFIESAYQDSTGRSLNCYQLTKKGCELYGTRMTGEKGTLFAVKYIERFNDMEQREKVNFTYDGEASSLEVALQAALKHEQELKVIRSDVDYLKGSMRIDSLQQQEIQQMAKRSVIQALGGKNSNAYKEISKKVFPALWNEFKQYFGVPRYPDLPKAKFDEGKRFVALWQPSTSLRIEIDRCNSQMTFE